jgi:glycerol-3-phosphate dehydrogenase subunit B
MNLHYEGGRSSNRGFLTATGAERHAAYLPTSFDPNKSSLANTSVGAFTNLRDFQPFYAANLRSSSKNRSLNVSILPLLHPFTERDLYPIDVARSFDDLDWTAENARAWKPLLIGSKSLGLPAVLGLRNHSEVLGLIEEILSIPVFEIPTLPPSIPGLRLEIALRDFATNRGTRFIEGPTARGRVQQKKQNARVVGALLETAGRQTTIDSQVTILATGSFLHGGLTAAQDHRVFEPVFNIPVSAGPDRGQWVQESIFAEQNYSKMGIAVDEAMHPLDVNSEILYENLYAVGGILRGSDRTHEGSRQGIDIATAHCAVDHLQRWIN